MTSVETSEALMTKTTFLLLEPGASWPDFLDRCPSDSHELVVFPRHADETHDQWLGRIRVRAGRFDRSGARVATTVIATPCDDVETVQRRADLLRALAMLPATRGCRVMLAAPSGTSMSVALETAATRTPISPTRNDGAPPLRSSPRAIVPAPAPPPAPDSVAPAA